MIRPDLMLFDLCCVNIINYFHRSLAPPFGLVLLNLPVFDQFGHFPKLTRHASCHSRSNFQRLMDADEVIEHEVQRQHVLMVFDLLAESISKARKPAHPHTHIQALPFPKRSADLAQVLAELTWSGRYSFGIM